MTSKEALEKLFKDIKQFEKHFVGCICNETQEEYYLIKKDLEILEIIKRKKVAIFVIPLCKNAYDYSMKTSGFECLTDKEFKLIKEWLEE